MSASVLDIQRQLDGLNPSDETYRQLLQELLTHPDLKKYIHGLQETNLQRFVGLLDEALNHIQVTDDLFRKTLRRLQSICSNQGILPSPYLIPNENLSNRVGPIAPGDFGDAFEAELGGKKVCIKVLRSYVQDTSDLVKRIFYREVVVWKRLQHPNIVPFLGVPTQKPPPFEMVFDLMENGTLTEFVTKYPKVDRIGLLWDVADGLHFLHSCNIVHGNLKGANVLIDKDGHARLTDFGLASVIQGDNSTRSPQDRSAEGTKAWVAPEILRGGAVTKESDVFTFSMVAVEAFTGSPPFASNYQTALYSIMAGTRPARPDTMSHDGLWELIQRCWGKEPEMRPTTLELFEFFPASFPGGRDISRVQALPNSPSSWSLTEPGIQIGGTTELRTDLGVTESEPRPSDLSPGGSGMPEPEVPPPEDSSALRAESPAASLSLLRRLSNVFRNLFAAVTKAAPRGRALERKKLA